jgi:hypothetical protein
MQVVARIWEEEKRAVAVVAKIGSDVLDALHEADPKKVEVVGAGCSCPWCLATNSTMSSAGCPWQGGHSTSSGGDGASRQSHALNRSNHQNHTA